MIPAVRSCRLQARGLHPTVPNKNGWKRDDTHQDYRNRALPDSPPRHAVRQHARRDHRVRTPDCAPSGFRWRRGRGLHLYRRPQRRRGRRHSPPRDTRTDRGSRGRRHRSHLAPYLVGSALWRPWRSDRAGALGCRHRTVGPEGAPRRIAAVASTRRLRRPCALLRRRHRSRSFGRGPATADRRQSSQGLSCHQDEGRPARSCFRCCARAGDAKASRRGLSVDGGCQHEMDGRGSDPGGARPAALRSDLARRAHHSRRCRRSRARSCRGRRADRGRREPALALGIQELHQQPAPSPIPSPM